MEGSSSEASTLCKLVLAQLVYEKGEGSFDEVSELLKGHVLLQDEGGVPQTAEECEQLYNTLLEERGIKRDDEDAATAKRKTPAPWVKKLAQSLYMAYTEQLLGLIKQDEEEFKQVFHHLEEIKKQQSSS
ncbi:hypothetical protein TRICI_001692 [Trichomonascus ciferrii]|uniref:Uncharacterized protein n=1 Tax=Trichomonascus ciferrii TaxID=44093 RepID=A0A642V7T4_9ASCO|nr:hypothetical protein TRICI_001692 [Trichomonascus ciferrii]